MCGIVGYVGEKHVVPVLLDGLKKLEYRGYDSAGIAVVDQGNLFVRRAPGKLRNLETNLKLQPIDGTYGVGHTRWATHGRPSEQNAHPHRDASGRIVVVHNGVIENHAQLKQQLLNEGHTFVTQTDTEVIAHLIGKLRDQVESLEDAVRRAVAEFQGIYAIAVMSADEPDKIVTARLGPPIVIGLGNNEYFIASDIPAILEHTRDMFFLADQEMAVLTRSGVLVTDFEGMPQSPNIHRIMWDAHMVEKGGFRHYMLKEIYEQPRSIRDTLLGRVSVDEGHVYLDNLDFRPDEWREFSSIKIAACGTSWHAAMVGKFLIEELARIPVEVDYASEFRYRDPLLDQSTLTVVVTQSGETADTVAALREAKSKNSRVIAVCNVLGSMATREADATVLTQAGPEISVASTKAFTSQVTALYLLALYLAQERGTLDLDALRFHIEQLLQLPMKMESVLNLDTQIDELGKVIFRSQDFLYLGRGIFFPIALEGALKLKEISYIHAEGYPAGEMKHGPNALIDDRLPVVFITPHETGSRTSEVRYEKTLSNMQEVKAREGIVIAVVTEGDSHAAELADYVIEIPAACDTISAILAVVPLQLLAYHIAIRRGCDVDQPRNLAKSVTVE